MNKEEINQVIKKIAKIFNGEVKWFVGASSALFVHGLDIMPNDIDIVIDTNDYNKAKKLLSNFLIHDTEDLGFTLKTVFQIEEIYIDLIFYDIDDQEFEYKEILDIKVPVHRLEIELRDYKKRIDKEEVNKKKIALIEAELERRDKSTI